MNHVSNPILVISIFVLISQGLNAQHPRFQAGLIGGLNFAELEGEKITSYAGLNAGLLGTARFAKHAQIGLEFLFSQNGEYILPERYPAVKYGKIRLNHLEIPVHLDLLIGVFEREKFYDLNLGLGLAWTRLLGHYVEDIDGQNVSDQVIYGNRETLLLQPAMTCKFTPKIGLNLKASLPVRVDGLSWTLAGRLVYLVY